MTKEQIIDNIITQKPDGIDSIKETLRKSIADNSISVSENVFQQMLSEILYGIYCKNA